MTTYILTYGQDQEHGTMGFCVEGTSLSHEEYNMATNGVLIAHDILEHARLKDIGTVGDELKALGGVWFVRGRHGELRRDGQGSRYSPEENIAGDVVNMGRDIILDYKNYRQPIPKRPRNCDAMEAIDNILEHARHELPKELEGEEWGRIALDKYLENCRAFMEHGYNHAKKRFSGLGEYGANNLFWNIADEVNKALKWCEYEGQQFKLVANFKTARIYCEEHYGEAF